MKRVFARESGNLPKNEEHIDFVRLELEQFGQLLQTGHVARVRLQTGALAQFAPLGLWTQPVRVEFPVLSALREESLHLIATVTSEFGVRNIINVVLFVEEGEESHHAKN